MEAGEGGGKGGGKKGESRGNADARKGYGRGRGGGGGGRRGRPIVGTSGGGGVGLTPGEEGRGRWRHAGLAVVYTPTGGAWPVLESRPVLGGLIQWLSISTPTAGTLARGPGSPELSKSYMDMASNLFTFTFTHLHGCMLGTSSKATGRHRQSGKDCPAVQPRLRQHRGYDLQEDVRHISHPSIHLCAGLPHSLL